MEREYMLPEWEGSVFQQFAKNFCAKNAWRVQHILGDYDDCLAKCALDYVICCQRYGATCNSASQFMYCYKTWITAEFNTLSTNDSNERVGIGSLSTQEGSFEGDAELSAKLSEASAELKTVLKIFFDAPGEIMETLRKDATSCHPKQFFKSVLSICGISKSKSAALAKELQQLLGR